MADRSKRFHDTAGTGSLSLSALRFMADKNENEKIFQLPREVRSMIAEYLLGAMRIEHKNAKKRVYHASAASSAAWTRKMNAIGDHESALWDANAAPVTISGMVYSAATMPKNKEQKRKLKAFELRREEAERMSYRAVDEECIAKKELVNTILMHTACAELSVVLRRAVVRTLVTPE